MHKIVHRLSYIAVEWGWDPFLESRTTSAWCTSRIHNADYQSHQVGFLNNRCWDESMFGPFQTASKKTMSSQSVPCSEASSVVLASNDPERQPLIICLLPTKEDQWNQWPFQAPTMWCPQDRVQLVYKSNFTRTYGKYIYSYCDSQQLHNSGGTTL